MKTVGNGEVKKEIWSMGAAVTVIAAALALLVGVFIFYSNSSDEEAQVTQINIPLAPGNELPIAPITPPASPLVTPPYDNPAISQ
jgi:hypothetical protein